MSRLITLTCVSALAISISGTIGCSNAPPPVKPPQWKPQAQATAAMALYDKDSDGKISSAEMSPGLKAALTSIDSDGDKAISEQELAARIQEFADTQLGMTSVVGEVTYSGKHIPGAQVTFTPEPFLADVIKPATGTVAEDGTYSMRTEGNDFDAVQPGIYIVTVSKKNADGSESISGRYNARTELGMEVGSMENAQTRGAGEFNLRL